MKKKNIVSKTRKFSRVGQVTVIDNCHYAHLLLLSMQIDPVHFQEKQAWNLHIWWFINLHSSEPLEKFLAHNWLNFCGSPAITEYLCKSVSPSTSTNDIEYIPLNSVQLSRRDLHTQDQPMVPKSCTHDITLVNSF